MPLRLPAVLVMMFAVACAPSADPDADAPAAPVSPEETVQAMLEAAQAGDWESYVDDFYGEQDKFGSDADRDALIARFRDRWGSDVLPALEAASQIEPTLSEDGERAVFTLESGDFTLHRSADGSWGFHL